MIYLQCGIDVSDVTMEDIGNYFLSRGWDLGKRVNQMNVFIKYVGELPVEYMLPIHDNFADNENRKEEALKFLMNTENLINPYSLIEEIRRLRSY